MISIVNPFGTAVVFLSLTEGFTEKQRENQAGLTCLYMAGVLITSLVLGSLIMTFFGISIPGLRASPWVVRVLGSTGMGAIGRIMGFLLVCVGIQFLVDGAQEIMSTPEFWGPILAAIQG